MKKGLLVFFSLLFFSLAGYSQMKIKLTNKISHRVLLISEGMNVVYSKQGDIGLKKGLVQSIDSKSIQINNVFIDIDKLNKFGRKRKGSSLFQFACGFLGTVFIIDAINPPDNTPPCNGCQTTSTTDSGVVAEGVLLGSAFIALGINSTIRNSPKNLSKWTIEVVK